MATTYPVPQAPTVSSTGTRHLTPDSILTTAQVRSRWGRAPRANADGVDEATGLLRVSRGAWVSVALWESLPPWARSLARHYAVDKTSPQPPVFCLASAALLWRLPVLKVPPKPQVTSGNGGGRRRTARPVVGKVWLWLRSLGGGVFAALRGGLVAAITQDWLQVGVAV